MPSIGQDLRDRKIIQWAVAYLAGAWLVLQVLDVLAEVWSLSVPLQRGIQVFLAVGLLVTLVLAWYHGEQGRQRASGPELLIIAALLAIAAVLTGVLGGRGGATLVASGAGSSGADGAGTLPGAQYASGAPAAPGSATAGGPGARLARGDAGLPSIAVLPFADLSPGGDQGYFADGIAEEILNALAQLPGLNVTGRTSSFSLRGEAVDIPTIGARLGVKSVLEGSLRMDGDRVRITVQLISVVDGFHLWSEEYDRALESVFEIQEDIAREIVGALEVELGGRPVERAWAARTSPEAYEAYLRGRQAFHALSAAGWRRALEEYGRAAALDSSFAPARSGLAATRFAMGYFGLRPMEEMVPLARRDAAHALELDDSLAEPHAVRAYIALYYDRDWATTESEVRRALDLNPSDAPARHAYADLLTVLGDPEAGLRQVELGREADPLSILASGPAVAHLAFVGRYEELIDQVGTLRELFPQRPELAQGFLALAYWHLGRFDEALDEYRKAWASDPALATAAEEALAAGGPRAAMRAWADYMAARDGPGQRRAFDIARRYAMAGATDEAFRWLDRAYDEGTPSLLHVIFHPDFELLRDDPRFRAFLDRLGIPHPAG